MSDDGARVLFWCLTIFAAMATAVIGHIYMLIGSLREKIDTSVDALRRVIETDRANISTLRVEIAATMVTRHELDRQVERLIAEMERRIPVNGK